MSNLVSRLNEASSYVRSYILGNYGTESFDSDKALDGYEALKESVELLGHESDLVAMDVIDLADTASGFVMEIRHLAKHWGYPLDCADKREFDRYESTLFSAREKAELRILQDEEV